MAGAVKQTKWMNDLLEADDETLDAYTMAVAFALYRHIDTQWQCRPSVRRLALMARCSPNVVVDRIARLEAAGFVTVTRRVKAVSTYRLHPPSVAHGDTDTQMATPSDLSHEERQTAESNCASVASQNGSVSPGATEGVEGNTPSSDPVTHEPTGDEKTTKVTPKRIFAEMARRKLQVSRQMRLPSAPPEGCEKHRETAWLKKVHAELVAQHGFALDSLMARYRDRDPDWYVWHLDRDLARCDPTQPTREQTRAKIERERAEHEASLAAMTPEDLEAAEQARQDARRRLAEVNRRKDEERHLRLVAEVAS